MTQLAEMSSRLPAATAQEKMSHSHFLSKMFVVHTHKPTFSQLFSHSTATPIHENAPFLLLCERFTDVPRTYGTRKFCTENQIL